MLIITANGTYFATANPTIEWTGSDNGTGVNVFRYRVDGGNWHNTTTANIILSGLADGEHTITVWVYDWAGNIKDPTLAFIVDSTDPTLTIDTPEENANISATSVNVTWTRSDNIALASECSYRLDGNSWTNTTENWYEFTDLSEGTHTVSIRAYDEAGNTVQKTVAFTIDTKKPDVAITTPQSGAIVEKSEITVEWTGSDDGTGISYYEVKIADGVWKKVGTVTNREVTGLADGEHIIKVRAVDGMDRTSSDTEKFTVNTSPIGGPGMMEELAIGIGVGVAIAVVLVVLYFKKWKKE